MLELLITISSTCILPPVIVSVVVIWLLVIIFPKEPPIEPLVKLPPALELEISANLEQTSDIDYVWEHSRLWGDSNWRMRSISWQSSTGRLWFGGISWT